MVVTRKKSDKAWCCSDRIREGYVLALIRQRFLRVTIRIWPMTLWSDRLIVNAWMMFWIDFQASLGFLNCAKGVQRNMNEGHWGDDTLVAPSQIGDSLLKPVNNTLVHPFGLRFAFVGAAATVKKPEDQLWVARWLVTCRRVNRQVVVWGPGIMTFYHTSGTWVWPLRFSFQKVSSRNSRTVIVISIGRSPR